MTWKFWQWDPFNTQKLHKERNRVLVIEMDLNVANSRLAVVNQQLDAARHEARDLKQENERLAQQGAALRALAGAAERRLHAYGVLKQLESLPMTRPELLAAFKGVTPSTEWWRTVHALLNEQEEATLDLIRMAHEQGELAHFNRGRLAQVGDLREALLQHCATAQKSGPEEQAGQST